MDSYRMICIGIILLQAGVWTQWSLEVPSSLTFLLFYDLAQGQGSAQHQDHLYHLFILFFSPHEVSNSTLLLSQLALLLKRAQLQRHKSIFENLTLDFLRGSNCFCSCCPEIAFSHFSGSPGIGRFLLIMNCNFSSKILKDFWKMACTCQPSCSCQAELGA